MHPADLSRSLNYIFSDSSSLIWSDSVFSKLCYNLIWTVFSLTSGSKRQKGSIRTKRSQRNRGTPLIFCTPTVMKYYFNVGMFYMLLALKAQINASKRSKRGAESLCTLTSFLINTLLPSGWGWSSWSQRCGGTRGKRRCTRDRWSYWKRWQ